LLSHHTWNKKRCGINKELSMIIKIKYDKSTKQITVENDITEIVLSVTDSTKIDTNDELSFEIAADMSAYQDLFERDIEEEIE
jgi:YbbR domain-containing protein